MIKITEAVRLFQLPSRSRDPQIDEIPCIFPDDQGICPGEQLAADCAIRQAVRDFLALGW